MSLPDGYGQIYCSTWWGDYRNIQRSIVDKPDCILPSAVQNFITRTEADGATVEGKECLANSLLDLGYDANNNKTDIIVQAYAVRVAADSGTLESRTCLENTIYNLITI